MSATTPPRLSHADAAYEAGMELLQEHGDSPQMREVIYEAIGAATEVDLQERESSERRAVNGEYWREQLGEELADELLTEAVVAQDERDVPYWRQAMPELAEALATPAREKWSAHQVAQMASELGLPEDRIDVPALAKEGTAAMAYVAPLSLHKIGNALHRDLGIPDDKPIPQGKIAAAAKQRDDAGSRARLALRLLDQAQRSARR